VYRDDPPQVEDLKNKSIITSIAYPW